MAREIPSQQTKGNEESMKTETVICTCDMCGNPDAEEMRYSVQGRDFALDLCAECTEHFGTYMAAYIMKSRKVTYRNHTLRRDRARPVAMAQDRPSADPAAPAKKRGRPRKQAETAGA